MKSRLVSRAPAALLACLIPAGFTLAAENPAPDPAAEIEALRAEIQELRAQVLELQAKMAALAAPPPAAPGEAPATPPVEGAAVPPPRSPGLLNPAISAVFQAIGTTSFDGESDENGFSLSEAEVAFQSVVDPYAKVDLFLSFPADESPEVEEATVATLALPGSLQLKGGRFKNAFGKWNTLHTHAFYTVERPLAWTNFLGGESLTTDGLSLSVLIPNPGDLYIESSTEIGTAREGVSFNSVHRDLTALQRFSGFFNPTPNATLELGLSGVFGKVGPSPLLEQQIEDAGLGATLAPREDLDSRVYGFDATFKWKPLAMNTYRSVLWQTELLESRREVEVLTPAQTLSPDKVSSLGGYTYGEWQFTKRWRVGLRYDLSGFPDSESARESGVAGVLRFQPSEFQELRFQINHRHRNDEAALRFGGDANDTRIFFEWIPVIGAHGAHKY